MMEEFDSLACKAPRKQRTLAVSEQLQAAEGAQLPAAAVTSAETGAPPSVTFPSPWSRWERNGFVHNLQSAFLYFYIFFKSFLFTETWCIDWKVRFSFFNVKEWRGQKGQDMMGSGPGSTCSVDLCSYCFIELPPSWCERCDLLCLVRNWLWLGFGDPPITPRPQFTNTWTHSWMLGSGVWAWKGQCTHHRTLHTYRKA